MKSNISKMGSIFLSSLIILSGCSDSNLKYGISNPDTQSLTEGDSNSLEESLTQEEALLSKDSSYISLQTKQDLTSQRFNQQQWPKSCLDFKDGQIVECSAGSKENLVGLRDIRIAGQVLVIDAEQSPWNTLNKIKNIRSLRIDADKVVIRSRLHLPSTHVQIIAEKLVVESSGIIDVTPVDSGGIRAEFGKDLNGKELKDASGNLVAYDGKDGDSGASISIRAKNLTVLGEKEKVHFVARGGAGDSAGQGKGQTAEDFAKSPLRAASVEAIKSIPSQFADKAGSIIYSAAHISDGKMRRFGHGDASSEIWYPIITREVGSPKWPSDGTDALPGGYPGAGGQGGVVRLFVGNIDQVSQKIADVNFGENGAPDYLRKGSLGGLPNPAYQIAWSGGKAMVDFVIVDTPKLIKNVQKDGADAQGPAVPKDTNSQGEFILEDLSSSDLAHSVEYFEVAVKRIKELYFSRKYDTVVEAVNHLQMQLDSINGSDMGVSGISAQLTNITQSIANQKDYFGRGLRDAPSYTFMFNTASFNYKLERMIRSYYLATVFERKFKSKEERESAAYEILKLMEQKFSDTQLAIGKSLEEISSIVAEISQAEKNQTAIEQELQNINEQIAVLAKSNVNARKAAAEFGRFVDVAAAICQVIPAGQPALGVAATLTKTIVKGPEDTSLSGWVDYYKQIKGQFNGYEKKADFEKSKASFSEFKAKFDAQNLRNLNIEEKAKYIADLYEELSPSIDKVSEALTPLNQPIFPEDEIQKEIAKIQTSDPTFKPLFEGITKKLADLVERKAKIQNDLLVLSSVVSTYSVDLRNYVVVSTKISESSFNNHWADDGVLAFVFKNVAKDSEDELLRTYAEVVSSYEYTTLREYSQDYSILALRQKMTSHLMSDSVSSESLKEFYISQIDLLKTKLLKLIESGSSLTNTNEGFLERALTAAEIRNLDKDGYVDVELTPTLYLNRDNVRITKVAVAENSYYFVKTQDKSSAQTSGMSLRFELSSVGQLKLDNILHTFHYPKTGDLKYLFKWDHQFQFMPGSDNPISHENQNSAEFRSLLSAIMGLSNSHLDAVFSSHAGLTKVRVKRLYSSGDYKLKNLTVRVNYIYSK